MHRKRASCRVGKPGVLLGLSSKPADRQRKAEVENESKKRKKAKTLGLLGQETWAQNLKASYLKI